MHCGYPDGRRRGADRRARRAGRRGRGAVRPRSSGTAATTARSRSASRPTTPSGRCSGRAASRRSPRSGGSAPTTSCRTASSRGPRCPRCCAGSPSCPATAGVRVANVFHAGDGNLHPLVLFDDAVPGPGRARRGGVRRDPRPVHRARRLDHRRARRRAWTRRSTCRGCSPTTTSTRCSCCAAPSTRSDLSNPGKIFPTPRLCGERPGPAQGRPPAAAGRPGGGLLMRCHPQDRAAPAGDAPRRAAQAATPRGRPRTPTPWPASGPLRRGPASTEQAAARAAASPPQHDLAVVVARGGGTKLDWGAPPSAGRPGGRHHRAGPGRRARRRRPGRAWSAPARRSTSSRQALAGAGQQLALDHRSPAHGRRHGRHRAPAARAGCSTARCATC